MNCGPRRARYGFLTGVVLAVSLLTAGCRSEATERDITDLSATEPTVESKDEAKDIVTRSAASRVKAYSSLAELVGDTQAVAEVSVTSLGYQTVGSGENAPGIPVPIARVTTTKVIAGELPDEFNWRVLTAPPPPAELSVKVAPRLELGASYVIFVRPFEWASGEPGEDWVVPGTGIYRKAQSGELRLVSTGPDRLPEMFDSIEELAEAISAAS